MGSLPLPLMMTWKQSIAWPNASQKEDSTTPNAGTSPTENKMEPSLKENGSGDPLSSGNGANTSTLSVEEFHRLQNQLLELRTQNYKLGEDNVKLGNERRSLLERIRSNEEELQKSKTSIFRRRGTKDADALEEEVGSLRRKLATQEEEFRLQQATLMEELNKVVTRSDEMERELSGKQVESAFDAEDEESQVSSLKSENVMLRNQLEDLRKVQERAAAENREQLRLANERLSANEEGGIEELAQAQSHIRDLQLKLEEAKGFETRCKELEGSVESLKGSLKAETDEKTRVTADLKQEVASLNEKFRKKQESYVQLNGEKERQYQEFKKSLDSMTQKKDSEIASLVAHTQLLKQELKTVDEWKEKEELWKGEKASLEQDILSLRADMSTLRDQNEGFQIQLQETHSANDCLSAQLQEARDEVLHMQAEVEAAEENAGKRKKLLDDMAKHLDEMKDQHQTSMEEAHNSHAKQLHRLTQQLEAAQESNSGIEGLNNEISSLRATVSQLTSDKELGEEDIRKFKEELKELEAKSEGELEAARRSAQEKFAELRSDAESQLAEKSGKIEEVLQDKVICMESIARLKQEGKDKDDQLKVLGKKQNAVMKDMKRQMATEKKRADRLQEKLQEVLNEIGTRAKSPGFEEIKPAEVLEGGGGGGKRTHKDSGSISGWSMLSGNNHKTTEPDRQSNHTNDGESNSSVTMLESENQDLVSRLTHLQKAKFELEERVLMLEESSGAMAEDLVNKSAIIEQFVKEKPGMSVGPGSPTTMERLPGGLKKVMDFVKLDQSAGGIREMNRRLQLMLEETLTKNMHLQKDLEIMSQEVSRLTELHPQEKIRKL